MTVELVKFENIGMLFRKITVKLQIYILGEQKMPARLSAHIANILC